MTLFIILATAAAAYLGSPWWVSLFGAGLLFAGSLHATASFRAAASTLADHGIVTSYALMHSALNASAASAAAFLLGMISRHLWG